MFDPNALTEEDEHTEDEQRFVSIGLDPVGRLLVVVYTFRGEDIRLISARWATRREWQAYEAGI
ncbi:BrnT family toxin [Candidatus Methylomirabilis sp.]|uniref:BrnT family toxin n=1 Tax=Candidatus Methylomirabilis sp. TaxID=2032687 RepID=UPI003075F7A9